jgi:hypothetical protein
MSAERMARISGKLPTQLLNDVSDAVHKALSQGMEIDEACCLLCTVAADYGRGNYGSGYIEDLVKVLRNRRDEDMPSVVG